MNILFLTLLDFSAIEERNIYTDLLGEFIKEKHNVFIVSPTEKRKQEPTKLLDCGNCKILKLRIGNIQKTSSLEKGISTLLVEAQFKKGIQTYFPDVVFDLVIYSTPPITLQKAVEYVKKRDGAKSYLLLKDIFPQNAVDLGLLNKAGVKSPLYLFLRKKEKNLYKHSDFIGCMSDANAAFLLKNNPEIPDHRVEVCPNSITPGAVGKDAEKAATIREKYGMPHDRPIFLYGGNLGKPQGIDFLIECLKACRSNAQAYFLIVGSGTEYGRLRAFFDSADTENAQLLPCLPKEEYDMLTNICDVGLIFLDRRFTIPNFPSRILSYMEASLPILAATDRNTDLGKVIEAGEFGLWCESADTAAFCEKVRMLCDSALREKMGANARTYLEDHYTSRHSYEIIMRHFEQER